MFRKPFDVRPAAAATCSGNRKEPKYEERIDEDGNRYLEQTGETDTYEIIQSYKDECDVNKIIERYAAMGELDALQVASDVDLTNAPKSYLEWANEKIRLENQFNALPLKIRQKFNNNFEEYAVKSGTDEWFEKMGYTKQTSETQVQPAEQKGPEVAE